MGKHSQEQIALLTDYEANSKYSNAYDNAYHMLHLHAQNRQETHPSILLVTPSPYPGQATAPSNIAIAAARSGTPTILVDADLYAPSIQQRFGGSHQQGLSDLLFHQELSSVDLNTYLDETFVPDLYLLGAGTALSDSIMIRRALATQLKDLVALLKHFLQKKNSRTGMIVFHSPAVLAGSDASLIGTQVDYIVFTIVARRTTHIQVQRAQDQLAHSDIQVTGAILLDL